MKKTTLQMHEQFMQLAEDGEYSIIVKLGGIGWLADNGYKKWLADSGYSGWLAANGYRNWLGDFL